MSNPLLKPHGDRFRPPTVNDQSGANPFAEQSDAASERADTGNAFAATGDEARPYQPRFAAQVPPRSNVLLVLAAVGWLGCGIGWTAIIGWSAVGWICPLLGLAPAAAALLLAWEDLKAIAAGAMAEEQRSRTRLALAAGLLALVACAATVGLMIYQQLSFLPDVL